MKLAIESKVTWKKVFNISVTLLMILLTAQGSFQNGWFNLANLVSWLGLIGVVGLAERWKGNFLFNGIQNLFAAVVAGRARLFGDCAMSLFYFGSQFFGARNWKKNTDENGEVIVDKSSNWRLISIAIVVGFVFLGGVSWYLGGAFILLDAFNNSTAIVAQVLQMQRKRVSWLLWGLTNVVGIYIWLGVGVPQMGLMFAVFTLNSIRGFILWGDTK